MQSFDTRNGFLFFGSDSLYLSHRCQGLESRYVGISQNFPVIEGIEALFFLTVYELGLAQPQLVRLVVTASDQDRLTLSQQVSQSD